MPHGLGFGGTHEGIIIQSLTPPLPFRYYPGPGIHPNTYSLLDKLTKHPTILLLPIRTGFRLFITESYEQCRAAESCMTFESGKLMPDGQGQGLGQGPNGGGGGGDESMLGSDRYQFELGDYCLTAW